MNRRDAALHLARRYPGGLEALAPRMGKRADTLRKELTGVDGYKWGTDDEELMMALCQAARVEDPLAPIQAVAVNAGAQLLPLPPDGDESTPAECLATACRSFAAFVASSTTAQADRNVSANDLRQIERDAGALVSSTQHLVTQLRALHEHASKRLRAVNE
jgi:hypothetical protein